MPDELVGKRLELLIPERFRQNHAALLQEYFRQPTPRPLRMGANFFGLQKNGHEFPLDIALSPVELERETRIICTIRPV
jgi:protein-histidine pros-kinase